MMDLSKSIAVEVLPSDAGSQVLVTLCPVGQLEEIQLVQREVYR